MPPLRERREDIPQLVQHFAKLTGDEHNLKPKKFDAAAMEALQRYRWRGNIRELRNTVERLLIMTPGRRRARRGSPGRDPERRVARRRRRRLTPGSLPRRAPSAAASASSTPPGGTLREFKDAAERAYLVQKLRENNWNISKTAEVIDTPRSNLYKKLEQYGIKQEVDG